MEDIRGQRWAVTGAAGTIGRALREHLDARGIALVSIDIAETTPMSDADRVWPADVRDLAALEAAFAGCAGVIHLGGIPDEADFHDLAEVNIVGTYHVLEAARRAGVGRVVFASSNRLTGYYPAGTLVDEAMPPRPDGFYGASKVAGEALCRLYVDKFALSTIVIRIGSYEAAPGSPREMSTWLSPADALRAFDAAMHTPRQHAVFYGVSHNSARWWSLDEANKTGFVPRDDAAAHGEAAAYPAEQPQGGPYAAAEYSTQRMRAV
ncbi:NAD-dependent epimerase/dehydratase family protein [Leucobacter sp. M11]|uniref:NAD-dependent epimerase/dehydratase family protein n=1 Tax=Leucobacter sp. M11 TaxID=2993565 RepID=UPI002D7F57DE|nr:NAD(P)-dependent oxidoreductase [Leucobacter sp. M11]MEB4614800.1 NAD(P)-dependent oxidoreductase [Leucobacter sp. M11]